MTLNNQHPKLKTIMGYMSDSELMQNWDINTLFCYLFRVATL